MSRPSAATIVRAQIMHTPVDPFHDGGALEAYEDGGLAFRDGRILATGDFAQVRRQHPDAHVIDARDALLLPGLVDAHVHYPQLGVIGSMGLQLLDWLEQRALPEEARLADTEQARLAAGEFVRALVANGTTTALVFGSHFPEAQDALFAEAERVGMRLASGLVVSDINLLPELERSPETAYADSRTLIERWHNQGRLRYAVTPRFSLSCSEAMLEVCGTLLAEFDDLLFTSHINENRGEIAAVAELHRWSRDYLETYERYELVGASSVLAHDVHPTGDALRRLSAARAHVAHCPSSNSFLGSGLFPMRRHHQHGVRFALGTDIGAGSGPSLFKEALLAYQLQMVHSDGYPLRPAHLLYLATKAGADALGLADNVGDLAPGRSADYILVRPPSDSTLEAVVRRSPSAEHRLGAVFALAREDSLLEARVAGEPVFRRARERAP